MKIIQSGGFLGRLLWPLLKTGLPLLKNVLKPLAKIIFIPLGLTTAISAADVRIRKNFYDLLVLWSIIRAIKQKMEDLLKIVKSLEDSGLLIKVITQTIENETEGKRGGFFGKLIGT